MIHKRLVEEVKALAQDWKVVAAETSKGDAFDLKKQALLGRLLSLPEADLKDTGGPHECWSGSNHKG